MTAYYNEIDPFCNNWLRNLMKAGLIAKGEVDNRSIEDVKPEELEGFDQCHFFAGIGAWSYALRQAGWADDRPVWTGSCPCQPFSGPGKRAGFTDERHLWPAFHFLIEQCGPSEIFGEQVASIGGLTWFDLVQTDLEGTGYAVGALNLPAAGVGAPHIRQRLVFAASRLGNAVSERLERYARDGEPWYQSRRQQEEAAGSAPETSCCHGSFWSDAEWRRCTDDKWRAIQPGLEPLAPRLTTHVGRCRAYGNSIVAPLATEVIRAYMAL